jgi:hypothetical protein
MKTATNTKSARGRHFPALALLLAAVTLLAFAPKSAHAGYSVPFHARFITEFESVVEFPYLHITVNGQGRATSMGPTTVASTDEMVSMIDGSATATYTLTSDSLGGAIEDTLILAMTFQATDVPGGVTFTGSYTIVGGTGRFAAATGSGVVAGSALLVGSHNGIGSFSLSGGISTGPSK